MPIKILQVREYLKRSVRVGVVVVINISNHLSNNF